MMCVRKTSPFLHDLAGSTDWYMENAGPEIALRFVNAVEEAMHLIEQRPQRGKVLYPRHPRLGNQRRMLLPAPFQSHLLFYHLDLDTLVFDRLIHGARDLPRRLLNPES